MSHDNTILAGSSHSLSVRNLCSVSEDVFLVKDLKLFREVSDIIVSLKKQLKALTSINTDIVEVVLNSCFNSLIVLV